MANVAIYGRFGKIFVRINSRNITLFHGFCVIMLLSFGNDDLGYDSAEPDLEF